MSNCSIAQTISPRVVVQNCVGIKQVCLETHIFEKNIYIHALHYTNNKMRFNIFWVCLVSNLTHFRAALLRQYVSEIDSYPTFKQAAYNTLFSLLERV